MLRKTFRYGRVIFGTILAVVLAYIIYQAVNALGSTLKTVHASLITAGKSVSGDALFVRDEFLLPDLSASIYSLNLKDGEKVSAGGVYGNVYDSPAALNSYRENLEASEIAERLTKIASAFNDSYEVPELNRAIISLTARRPSEGQPTGDLKGLKSEFALTLLKRSYALGSRTDLSNELNRYVMLTENYERNKEHGSSTLISSRAGYYSSYADGYEEYLTLENAGELNAEKVDAIIASPTSGDRDLSACPGKLVTDFHWKILFPVSSRDASILTVGKRYEIELQGRRISAVLSAATGDPEKEERLVLVFDTSANISDFLSLRTSKIKVLAEQYTGYRIPSDALRVIDGKTGVFCLQGYVARFVEVKILWKTDTFYVVEADLTGTEGLFTNDTIIINTRGLYDGKVVTNQPQSDQQ
ncbi:MAG: hypothetical protein IJM21_01050 [Clostridia bacterium]|nr:hypothetical protein [Clostridia bacterium]